MERTRTDGARISSPSGVSSLATAALPELCCSAVQPVELPATSSPFSSLSPTPRGMVAQTDSAMQLNAAAIRRFLLDCLQHGSAVPAASGAHVPRHFGSGDCADVHAKCKVAEPEATAADAARPEGAQLAAIGGGAALDSAVQEVKGGRSHGSQHTCSELTGADVCASEAASKEQQDLEEADAAEVLLSFHTHRYKCNDLDDTMSGGTIKDSASASDAEAEPGVRTSTRKRKASTWLTAYFEPGVEQEICDKEQEWSAKQDFNPQSSTARDRQAERVDAVTHAGPAFQPLPAQHCGSAAGGYVTLHALRQLRDSGHRLDGLELLVHTGGDIRSPQSWQLTRVTKCDIDFKKVVVRFVISGKAEAINFHAIDRVVLFPPHLGFHPLGADAALAGVYAHQLEYMRQLHMLQLSQQLMMYAGQQEVAQLAAHGPGTGHYADARPQHAGTAAPELQAARRRKPAASRQSIEKKCSGARGARAARTSKVPSATLAIARALGLRADAIPPERNPQVKLRATMFDALRASLMKGRDKIMCKVTTHRGMRTAVLTGAAPGSSGVLVKYLDAHQPAVAVITQSDVAEENVTLEITQVIPISE